MYFCFPLFSYCLATFSMSALITVLDFILISKDTMVLVTERRTNNCSHHEGLG